MSHLPEDTEEQLWLDEERPLPPEEQGLLDETTEEALPFQDPAVVPKSRYWRRRWKPFPEQPIWSPANVLARSQSLQQVTQLREQAKELGRAIGAGKTTLDVEKEQELQKRREL